LRFGYTGRAPGSPTGVGRTSGETRNIALQKHHFEKRSTDETSQNKNEKNNERKARPNRPLQGHLAVRTTTEIIARDAAREDAARNREKIIQTMDGRRAGKKSCAYIEKLVPHRRCTPPTSERYGTGPRRPADVRGDERKNGGKALRQRAIGKICKVLNWTKRRDHPRCAPLRARDSRREVLGRLWQTRLAERAASPLNWTHVGKPWLDPIKDPERREEWLQRTLAEGWTGGGTWPVRSKRGSWDNRPEDVGGRPLREPRTSTGPPCPNRCRSRRVDRRHRGCGPLPDPHAGRATPPKLARTRSPRSPASG